MTIKQIVREKDVEALVTSPTKLKHKCLFRLLFCLGLRAGEAVHLKTSNVDLHNRIIKVKDSKKKTFILPIDDTTTDLLIEYIPSCTSEWLFESTHNEGHPITLRAVELMVKERAARLDLKNWKDYTPRTFRRFFARNWMRQKGKMTSLQRILRHTQIANTSRYCDTIRFECEEEEMFQEYNSIMNGKI